MGSKNSTAQDLIFENQWRPVNWSERETMLQTLKGFQENPSVNYLRILFVGPAGAGKSSFITSVNNAIQGRSTHLAHSLTDCLGNYKYTVYKLNKGKDGSVFPFMFGDTMGLDEGQNGVHPNDIISILQGHMREGYTFNPSEVLTNGSNDFNKFPTLHDKVHCLVFVLAAGNLPNSTEIPKNILSKAKELEIPVVVLMSKVDTVCTCVKENLTMIYRSKEIKKKMEECSEKLGVPMKQIFPVKNYHEEITNNTEMDVLILMAVTNIVNFANDFMKASTTPWRTVNWSERERILQTLTAFQASQNVDYLRILIVGPAGAGKSAFITSVNTALQGRNTYLAHSLTGGLCATCKYNVYNLNKSKVGSFFPFVFGDTMGLEHGENGARPQDIINILHGHVKEGYTINPKQEITAETKDFNSAPTLNDKVHCLVFVIPANNIIQHSASASDKIQNKMKQILQKAHELKIPVVVLMSKVDVACPLVNENLKTIYISKRIQKKMEECNQNLGIPLNYIFPVKNYHREITNDTDTDILILTAVMDIVNFANDFVNRKV